MAASNYTESPCGRYATLPSGCSLPVESIELALDLEARGFTLEQDGDTLIVQPYQRLTPGDCMQIRRWKYHLLAVLDYVSTREAHQ
jgi:hypothetical protein